METITFESKAFKNIKDQLNAIEVLLKVALAKVGSSKWIFEEEAKLLTNLSTKSLQRLRQKDVFRSHTVSGRKIQYLRSDVRAYVEGIL